MSADEIRARIKAVDEDRASRATRPRNDADTLHLIPPTPNPRPLTTVSYTHLTLPTICSV